MGCKSYVGRGEIGQAGMAVASWAVISSSVASFTVCLSTEVGPTWSFVPTPCLWGRGPLSPPVSSAPLSGVGPPLPLEVGPHCGDMGPGERISSIQPKVFRHKFASFWLPSSESFSVFRPYCPLKECFRDISLIQCTGRIKRFRAHNLAAVCSLIGGNSPPPLKRCLK